jgi:UDP-N-acetylmuramate-alanine ligase
MGSVESGVKQVAEFAARGDVVAVLSNGGFGGFIQRLLADLESP